MKGLGKKQIQAINLTLSKIGFALSKEPLTSHQLHIKTKIHKNKLGQRLDYLISRGIVIKHTRTSPPNLESKQNHLRAAYTYEYYLLNWSNPDAKKLLNYYYNYSPDYQEVKKREQESKERVKMAEAVRKAPLKRKERESEEDFKKREEEVKELNRQIEEQLQKLVQDDQELRERSRKRVIMLAKQMIRIEELELESLNQRLRDKNDITSSNIEEQSIKIQRAPLNVFIDFKVDSMFHEYNYTDIWEIMEEEGLLDPIIQHLKQLYQKQQ
jgi:hypothetical protein